MIEKGFLIMATINTSEEKTLSIFSVKVERGMGNSMNMSIR